MRSLAPKRVAALALALLLGVTSTGLPSHHHDASESGPVVVDAGHHGHGVVLVDTTERIVTQGLLFVLPSPSLDGIPRQATEVEDPVVRALLLPPDLRPPSSSRPRAPPVHG